MSERRSGRSGGEDVSEVYKYDNSGGDNRISTIKKCRNGKKNCRKGSSIKKKELWGIIVKATNTYGYCRITLYFDGGRVSRVSFHKDYDTMSFLGSMYPYEHTNY